MYGQKHNEYDVNQYTDDELYQILDINNPTDRELEAKIIGLVNKYNSYSNDTGDIIAKFYLDIYYRFFRSDDDDDNDEESGTLKEGYTNMTNPASDSANRGISYETKDTTIVLNDGKTSQLPANSSYITVNNSKDLLNTLGNVRTTQMGSVLDTTTDYRKNDTLLTKPLDYTKDKLNPLLKQTVRRILSIDSQYRDNKSSTFSTEFTFNLSEPLHDVVSLKLYSVGIPYSWYTVSRAYGANFFYIKGNSPGIDGGEFDYKISVPPGNYDAPTLVSTINTGIKYVVDTYTDMSFGNTRVIYNNGISSTSSGTGLSTIQIDMKKVFGESNYYIDFPTWTSTINNPNAPIVNANSYPQLYSIPSYMGFNSQTYNGTSIYSSIISGLSSASINADQVFSVNPLNSYFYIIPYVGGTSINTATTVYNKIKIDILPAGTQSASYTRTNLTSILNTALAANTSLDANYSAIYWRDISNVLQSYNQNSYFEMQIKLSANIAPMVNDLKVVAAFPDLSLNPIFCGTTSCFRFVDSYGYWTDTTDASSYYINELSDIYSEVPILQSNYNPGNGNVIQLICHASGYDIATNDYNIPLTNAAQYNLDDYLSFINTSIQNASSLTYNNEIYGSTGTQTQIRQDALSNILFDVHVKKIFSTDKYVVKAYGIISDIFGMDLSGAQSPNVIVVEDKYDLDGIIGTQVEGWDLSYNNSFINNYQFTSISFNADAKLIIYPRNYSMSAPLANRNAYPFIVNFQSDETFNSIGSLVSYLNTKLTTYSYSIANTAGGTSSTKTPFYNSSITYDSNNGFKLTLVVNAELSQEDYSLDFTSAPSIVTDLSFNNLYRLNDYIATNALVATVQNNVPKPDQLITIDASNNTFTFYPYSTITGLQTTGNIYKVVVTILPFGYYNIKQLHDAINAQLDLNPITKGTVFSTVKKADNFVYTKIRMNINKVFSTADFRLVFYDPYSFVTCTSGTTKSIQNVTWDTTIGWILGFREKIIYYLSDYVDFSYSYGTDYQQYYLTGAQSNVCVLIGDTATNTQLYNYFLIMLDDYVQNHLNDGLVTITNQETSLKPVPHIMVCDPVTNKMVARPADWGSPGITYTQKALYSFAQSVESQQAKINSYSKGPFVKDIFGFIPLKPGNIGNTYSEFGGTLQNQDRMYFGPVNIHRMTIRLLNDRGDLVDLNNNDWNFSLVCEQLYRNSTSN